MVTKKDLVIYLDITGGLLKATFQTAASKVLPTCQKPSINNQLVDTFKSIAATKEDLYQAYPEKVCSDDRSTTYWSFKTVLMDQLASKGWPTILSSSWDDNNPPSQDAISTNCGISNALAALMRCGQSEILLRFELNQLSDNYPNAAPLIFEKCADIAAANEVIKSFDQQDIQKSRTYTMLGKTGPIPI